MEKDCYGICLDSESLSTHRASTFTHVRAYKKPQEKHQDLLVEYAIPQMSGEQLLRLMEQSDNYVWRAEYKCDTE